MSRRHLLRPLFVLLSLLWLAGWIRPVLAQTETPANLVYGQEQIELHMRLNADGTIDVVELQQVRVDEGTLFSGFQNLSLRQLDGVSGLAVEADGRLLNLDESACLYCYWTITQPRQPDWVSYDRETFDIVFNPDSMGQVQTFWDFPGIEAGETGNFLIRYQALGAIQLFPQNQRLIWDVTPGFPVPVEVARLLITPPPDLTAADLEIDAGTASQSVDEQGRIVLEFDGAVPAETHWFVTISLPAGATAATPALWQQELEAAVAAAETARSNAFQTEQQQYLQQARIQFTALGLTLLILIAGAVLLARQSRGSGTVLPLQGLPPAALPYLTPNAPAEPAARALLAQLLALVDYGLIEPKELPAGDGWGLAVTPERLRERARWELPDGQIVRLQPAIVTSYQALAAAQDGQPLSPAAIADALVPQLPAIIEDILGDLEEALAQTPTRLIERNNRRGIGLLVLGAVSLLATALSGLGSSGWIAYAPAVALLLIGGLTYYRARLLAGAPAGLPTIAFLPNLTEALVRRGHSDENILKFLGGNYLRVFTQVWKE
ncbi:MAG: DUF2207 domain-containing protein [Anaerolineales bacterium]|nr:DUF2207 domain-containing protein [Anaerolineales bacterium]